MKSTPAPPKAVVVGYDGSTGSDLALEWAVAEARRTARPLHLVHASGRHHARGFEPSADLDPVTTLAVEQVGAKAPELMVTGQTREGSAAAVLVQASATAGTVVVGARGHGAFASVLVGSVSEQVATHAQCPVVVLRPESTERGSEAGRIVAGLDASERSVAALSYAYAQASSREVGLTVVHTWWWEEPGGFLAGATWEGDWTTVPDQETAMVGELLAGWHEQYPDVEVRRHLVRGHPVATLVEESRGAEMLVVGSRGRGGFKGLLLGSVSRRLLHGASCPVAVVRSAAAAAEGGPR
jgi:nucleotide-binding universal stress UspA family protein